MSNHKTDLIDLALRASKPFCSTHYKVCESGVCPQCGSDDLMRHVEGVGVPMSNQIKVTRGVYTATLLNQSTDSFGTRTLTVGLFSDALNESVIVTVTEDEGGWSPIKAVLTNLVDEQIRADVEAEGGSHG